jgi:hypothetical protein
MCKSDQPCAAWQRVRAADRHFSVAQSRQTVHFFFLGSDVLRLFHLQSNVCEHLEPVCRLHLMPHCCMQQQWEPQVALRCVVSQRLLLNVTAR